MEYVYSIVWFIFITAKYNFIKLAICFAIGIVISYQDPVVVFAIPLSLGITNYFKYQNYAYVCVHVHVRVLDRYGYTSGLGLLRGSPVLAQLIQCQSWARAYSC